MFKLQNMRSKHLSKHLLTIEQLKDKILCLEKETLELNKNIIDLTIQLEGIENMKFQQELLQD